MGAIPWRFKSSRRHHSIRRFAPHSWSSALRASGHSTFLSASRMTLSEAERSEAESKGPTINIQNMLRLSAMSWHVYIAQAPTGRYYTGITENPQQRIIDHNQGRGAKFSQDQGKLKLVYISSPFENKSSARLREIQIKGWTRVKKEKLIGGEWK